MTPRDLGRAPKLTPSQEARLQDAADLIAAVMEELDLRTTPCACCGLAKAVNWDHRQIYEQLAGMHRKLANGSPAFLGTRRKQSKSDG